MLATGALNFLFAFLLGGCNHPKFIHRASPQSLGPTAESPDLRYRVACPDVLEVSFADRPDWDAFAAIDLDGRLLIDSSCQPRVEGLTLDEVRDELAKWAGVPAESVEVALASPRSGQLFLNGPVRGRTRVEPYRGPETAIGFLTRVGGLPPGSKWNQVYVVRPHVATGQPPQVFRVNVEAVLLDNDPSTDVSLRPSDQVYVGETRSSSFSRSLPHWLGTAYRRVTGLLPDSWWPFDRP